MKVYLFLSLLVGQMLAAPLTGSMSSSVNAGPGSGTGSLTIKTSGAEPSIEDKIKGFESFLYLFAPDTWISKWNDISSEGKRCFLTTATDPANAEVYNSDDNARIKQDLQAKCASSYTQLAAFADQTEATMKSLPQSFLDISKSWGQQMQTLGNQFKNTAATSGTQNIAKAPTTADGWKSAISQFAKPTGDFMGQLATLSQEDRQKISDAFPKLQPFFSGDHAVEFLNEVTEIYKLLGAGNFSPDNLKPEAQKLATTWATLWEQYKSKNGDGLKKASDILGKDLVQAGDKLSAQLAAKANESFSGPSMSGFPAGAVSGSATGSVGAPGAFPGSIGGAPAASAPNTLAGKFAEKNPEARN